MTVGGKKAFALADKTSGALIRFDITGDPNHAGLPNWPAYKESVGATMMFDNVPEIKNHPDKGVLEFTAGAPLRF